MNAKAMWMVRAGEGSQFITQFIDESIIAIGWGDLGRLHKGVTREELMKHVTEVWPGDNKFKVANSAGQIYRFINEIAIGDGIVTYDSGRRIYLVGKVTSDLICDEAAIHDLRYQRKVSWEVNVPRDSLSISTKNTLGAIQTLFLLSDSAREEMLKFTKSNARQIREEPEADKVQEEEQLSRLKREAREFAKDRLTRLDWSEMQNLVAGLLRAMGYKTRVSAPGADRGIDILASPDGFGLEQPRIVVEVKHRKGSMGAQDLRTFLGGRHKDDKGLYVSTGGFTKDAYYEADRASIPLMLMDGDQLIDAIFEHYENLDRESQVLFPLVKIYWPAS